MSQEKFPSNEKKLNELESKILSYKNKIGDDIDAYEELSEFMHLILKHNPDAYKYSIWHYLQGSGIEDWSEIENRGDFSGKFSCEKFIGSSPEERREIIEELKNI